MSAQPFDTLWKHPAKIFRSKNWQRYTIHATGLFALLWFLIRVIPKPSRAMYPCQRAAFPLASAFVVWLMGFIASFFAFKRIRHFFGRSKYAAAASFLAVLLIVLGITQLPNLVKQTFADSEQLAMLDFAADSTTVLPKAVVSIVRSDQAKAEDIDSLEIYDMVRQAVELAGGFDDLIHDSSVVVLKPNLLTSTVMDENWEVASIIEDKVNSVTTDYRVIQAVVNLVRERNPNGKIYVMEGSGVGKTFTNMTRMGWFKVTGVDEFICLDDFANYGAWRDTNAKALVNISLPSGKALFAGARNSYYLNKIYYEADVLISIPALKTHCYTCVTGAVKNVGIGATPVSIYGGSSDSGRERINHAPASNYRGLHNWIHDFYMCRPVDFAIMDALTGMQDGPCPVTNDPVSQQKKNTRCILASQDPIALDAIEALIIQMDPTKVSHLVTLHNDSLGCADPRYIRVRGKRVDEVKDHFSNTITYAQYTDFDSPTAIINSYRITSDSLYLALEADAEVVKVEISIDNKLLSPIFTSNFDHLAVRLEKPITNPERVQVLVYDQYLNCTVIDLQSTRIETGSNSEPESFKLLQNFPNPFNPVTTISYSLPAAGRVELKVFDVGGREIKTLASGEQQAGDYKVNFDGRLLSSGIYLCKIKVLPLGEEQAGDYVQVSKMTLMK